MNRNEMLEIARSLAAKTNLKKALWMPLDASARQTSGGPDRVTAYMLKLPQSLVLITFREFSAAPDDYLFKVLNDEQKPVFSVTVESDDEGYETLKELYEAVDRAVLKWDDTVGDIKRALESDDIIGEDIPF